MIDWRRLARNRLLDVGIALIAIAKLAHLGAMLPERVWRPDFSHYYTSSRLLLEGCNPYRVPLAGSYQQLGFVESDIIYTASNPPALLWMFVPFAMLTPRVAFWLWTGVQGVSLLTILWLSRRLLGGSLTGRAWLFVVAAVVVSPAIYSHFGFSQVQLLLAAIVLAAYALRKMGRTTAACFVVAIAGLLKLYPFALLPWFIWRSDGGRSARLLRAFGVTAFVAVLVLLTGPHLWADFFKFGFAEINAMLCRVLNFGLPAQLVRLGGALQGVSPEAARAGMWGKIGLGAGVLALALGYALCARSRGDREGEFCLLSVAMLAAGTVTWFHYLVFAIFPILAVLPRLGQPPAATRAWWLGVTFVLLNNLFSLVDFQTPFLRQHPSWDVLANAGPLYGLISLGVLWVVLVRDGSRNPPVIQPRSLIPKGGDQLGFGVDADSSHCGGRGG